MVPITSQNLAYVDIDTDDHDIVYTITRPLAQEEGTIENVEQAFRPVRRFTQDDINKNKIIYRPPVTEIGANEKEFSFQFRSKNCLLILPNLDALLLVFSYFYKYM